MQAVSTSFLTKNHYLKNGDLAVDFFFVLSGFVIALNYQNFLNNLNKFSIFIKRRFFRLYPLHLVMLILYLLIEVAKYFFELYNGIQANEPSFSVNNLKTFISNIFLFHGIVDKELSYNEVSWSISFEFYTYLIFGLIAILFRNKYTFNFFVVLIFLISMILVLEFKLMDKVNNLGFFRCVYSFFFGIIIYLLDKKIKNIKFDKIQLIYFIILIYLFCYMENTALMPIFFGLFILILNNSDGGILKKILLNKNLIYLGKISYSIYMIHYLIIWIHIQVLRFIFNLKTEAINNYNYLVLPENQSFIFIVSVLIFVIFFSNLSYKIIEEKFKLK